MLLLLLIICTFDNTKRLADSHSPLLLIWQNEFEKSYHFAERNNSESMASAPPRPRDMAAQLLELPYCRINRMVDPGTCGPLHQEARGLSWKGTEARLCWTLWSCILLPV